MHDLLITDTGDSWVLTYGDQTKVVGKPMFRNPVKVLGSAVERVIADHDYASKRALASQASIDTVLSRFVRREPDYRRRERGGYTLPDPDRWGSEQIAPVKH